MITTDFNLSDPLNWLLLLLALMLLAAQVWILFKNKAVGDRKRKIRTVLNLLLWLLTVAFILQPYGKITSSQNNALVVGSEVPQSFADHIKDSIGIGELYAQAEFNAKSYDTIMLVGQDFTPQFYAKLSQSNLAALKQISYGQPNQLQTVNWEGILRKGQMQHVRGNIMSSSRQKLKISYAGSMLDSVMLEKGLNYFDLQFPVFVQGRVLVNLDLNLKTIGTIRFFARPAEARTYHFVLDSPDFETRTLADWLGQNGNAVILSTAVSKNIHSSKSINKTGETDVFITDPGNSSHPVIKKALADGKSILLIGLDQAEKDFVAVNHALGSTLNAERISPQVSVPISEGLTALPYKFVGNAASYTIAGLPVSVTKTNAKIGVSLLNETYPIMLSGDSVRYAKVWTSILAQILPPDTANMQIQAPLFKGIAGTLHLNNASEGSGSVVINTTNKSGTDTLFTNLSPLNTKSSKAVFLPSGQGNWMSFGAPYADAELYVEDGQNFKPVYQNELAGRFVAAYSSRSLPNASDSYSATIQKHVPGYVWLSLFLLCFTALWMESKLS